MSPRTAVVLGIGSLIGFAALSFLASLAGVEYIDWVGQTESLAFWAVLTAIGFGLGAFAMETGMSRGIAFRGAPAVAFGAPLLGYARGGVGEIGVVLLYAALALPVVALMRRRSSGGGNG